MRTQVGDIDPGQDQESRPRRESFSRSCRVHPMKLSRGASFHAAVEKPSMASGQPSRSRRISPTRVSEELLPGCRARRGAGRAGGPCRGSSGPGARFGVRPEDDRPGPVLPSLREAVPGMASMATLAIMSLRPPSGLNQPMRRQNSFDSIWRFNGGGHAISEQRHFPGGEVAAVIIDRAGHAGAMSSRLAPRSSTQPRRQVVIVLRARWSHMSSGMSCHSSRAEYMIVGAVLAVGTDDSRRPMAGPVKIFRRDRGTCGRSTNTLSPSRW